MKIKTKTAMTIFELILTLIIIAVASGLTIGVSSHVAQQKQIEALKTVFNNEVAVALADMHANGELVGYGDDQAKFSSMLKKYFNIELLSQDEISSKFAESYVTEDGIRFNPFNFVKDGVTVKMKNWAVSSKGVSVAYTYDKECNPNYNLSQDASSFKKINGVFNYLAKNEALGCIVGFYDVNGAKGPNEIGKDVGIFTDFPHDCENPKFIPGPDGKCPPDGKFKICSKTEMNCQKERSLSTLNKNTCECECKIKCPFGKKLNEKTCTCGCNETEKQLKERLNSCYVDWNKSKAMCGCVPKDANAKEQCEANGGKWDDEHCMCDCNTDKINSAIKEHCNYVYAESCSPNGKMNYCKLNCYDKTKFTEKYKSNVGKAQFDSTIVNYKDSVSNYCFTCKPSGYTKNVKGEKIKQTITKKQCYCSSKTECLNLPTKKDKDKYGKLFTFNDNVNSCKWECKKSDLDNLVDKANNELKPRAIINDRENGVNKNSDKNYKIAQQKYAKASIIGYVHNNIDHSVPCDQFSVNQCVFNDNNIKYVEKDGTRHIVKLNINGTDYYIRAFHSCFSCGRINSFINSNNKNKTKFDSFIYYLDYTASKNVDGFSNKNDLLKTYKYALTNAEQKPDWGYTVKNYNTCEIGFNGLNWGIKNDSISFHTANIDTSTPVPAQATHDEFNFYAINDDVTNPYSHYKISVPKKDCKGCGIFSKNFKNQTIGAAIEYKSHYDPIAINMDADSKYPSSSGIVKPFAMKYEDNKFIDVNVDWPAAKYQFIVMDGFENNKNVGYMLSDTYNSKLGKTFVSGFEALEQYDFNGDGLVSRDEFMHPSYHEKTKNLPVLMLWNQITDKISHLDDTVFDFNTARVIETSEDSDSENMIFKVQGEYRKLKPITHVSNLSGYMYSGEKYVNNNQKIEIWKEFKLENGNFVKLQNPQKLYYRVNTDGIGTKTGYQKNNCWYDNASLNHSIFGPSSNSLYYNDGSKWYNVVTATMLDIVFRAN